VHLVGFYYKKNDYDLTWNESKFVTCAVANNLTDSQPIRRMLQVTIYINSDSELFLHEKKRILFQSL